MCYLFFLTYFSILVNILSRLISGFFPIPAQAYHRAFVVGFDVYLIFKNLSSSKVGLPRRKVYKEEEREEEMMITLIVRIVNQKLITKELTILEEMSDNELHAMEKEGMNTRRWTEH